MSALAEILARPDVWRGDRLAEAPLPAVATGFPALDAALPGGGWPRGALSELLVDGCGVGELSLLMPALCRVREEGGWTLLVAPPHPLHAPAWAAAGIDLFRLAIASPAAAHEGLWALEQALASGAPHAVAGWLPYADARAVRRLQVAAATGRALAFLFRPVRAAGEASAAPLRLRLEAGEGGLLVHVLKRRGPPLAAALRLAVPRPAPLRRHEPAHEASLAGHPANRHAAFV